MMRQIVTPLLRFFIFFTTAWVMQTSAMELSDLPQYPDEKKIERKPAIVYLKDEELAQEDLKKDIDKNIKNLDVTTKTLQEMGLVVPACADCDSLTNKKSKGRSPAVEIVP